jgi:ABC-type tungstate transport system substrate-binding protein
MRKRPIISINARDLLLFINPKSLKTSAKAIVLKMPNATSLGRFTGSTEFQGDTKIETMMDVKIT